MNAMAQITMVAGTSQPFNFGVLEQNLVSNEAVVRLLMACVLGGLIGIEREWKSRSAGA